MGGADCGGEGVIGAGARVHVYCGIGEFDRVLVAVLNGPRECFLPRLRPGRGVRQLCRGHGWTGFYATTRTKTGN